MPMGAIIDAMLCSADGCQSKVAVSQRPIMEASYAPRVTLGAAVVKADCRRYGEKCGKKGRENQSG